MEILILFLIVEGLLKNKSNEKLHRKVIDLTTYKFKALVCQKYNKRQTRENVFGKYDKGVTTI